MAKTVRDMMSKTVESLGPADSVIQAARLMKDLDVGSIPVVEHGKVCGIITDRDIVLRVVASGGDVNSRSIREVMTDRIVVAAPDWDLARAAKTMAEEQIRRLPVVENGQLVGMLALGDVAVDGHKDRVSGEALSEISAPAHPKH
jgi:CBS domain-containing protein